MFNKNAPFDEIIGTPSNNKAIPKKAGEEFVEYLEFLATSPQLDASKICSHILEFLNLPKVKNEVKRSVYYALHDLSLPDSFWLEIMPSYKTELQNKDSPFIAGIIYSLSAAPLSVIFKQFDSLLFLNQYVNHPDPEVQYASLSTLYVFRNHIRIDKTLVDLIFQKVISTAIGRGRIHVLIACINFLIFFIDIDFPNIINMMETNREELINIIIVHGHLLNIKILAFLIKYIKPRISTIFELIPHVGLPGLSFLYTCLPDCPDFELLSNVPSSSFAPKLINTITDSFSEGIRDELIVVALNITKVTKSRHIFDQISSILFSSFLIRNIKVISLFVEVSYHFSELSRTLERASLNKQRTLFYNLSAISAIMGARHGFDVSKELIKILSDQDSSREWRLSASCVGSFIIHQMHFVEPNFQQYFEVVSQIQSPDIRALLLILLAENVPVHLRHSMLQKLKEVLFPSKFQNFETPSNFKCGPDTSLPLLIRILLVRALRSLAKDDDLDDVSSEINSSIFKHIQYVNSPNVSNSGSIYSSNSFMSPNTQRSPVISPFFCCEVPMVGRLALAMTEGCHYNFMGVHRPFIRISPDYHAMCVEIETIVVPQSRSLEINLRLSTKGIVPNLVVDLNVPLTLTPPQVDPWKISSLSEGQKVSRKIAFTINRLTNPYANLIITQDGNNVFETKICLPLIDMFDKAQPDEEMIRSMWWKMKYEKKDVSIENALWVQDEGCIVIKDHVARATQKEFLDFLSSAYVTKAVIQ